MHPVIVSPLSVFSHFFFFVVYFFAWILPSVCCRTPATTESNRLKAIIAKLNGFKTNCNPLFDEFLLFVWFMRTKPREWIERNVETEIATKTFASSSPLMLWNAKLKNEAEEANENISLCRVYSTYVCLVSINGCIRNGEEHCKEEHKKT